uniref:USP8_dimer domain-containing protein n=1 Tax=Panagrellus redivivus TaxID=6233 RepID=A0A7E4W2H4_PANRE
MLSMKKQKATLLLYFMKPLPQTSRIQRFRSLLPKSRPHRLKLPLIKVCQTLDSLFDIAMAYFHENQLEKAFGYFLRFVDAAVDKLPKHPNYNDITAEYKEKTCRQTIRAIKLAEKLKSKILNSYFSHHLKNGINNVE